jgi:hypothetical protein
LLKQNLNLLQLLRLMTDGGRRENNPSDREENPFIKYPSEAERVGQVKGETRYESGMSPRHRVRIVSKRVRLCDPDNLVGGVKHLVDALRIANIIPEDDPQAITLEVSQEKVSSYAQEETWVEVSR